MRLRFSLVMVVFAAVPAVAGDAGPRVVAREAGAPPSGASRAYQGRTQGRDETERFSRRVRLGRDGRVSVGNIAGEITVTAGGGDEVSIEAVKRTRGDQRQLGNVRIDVDEGAGRVDVRAMHMGRNDRVSVDFTLTVPASASVELHSVSGSLRVAGVRGTVRAETVSGNVTATDTPKLEAAKSVSGEVSLTGVSTDGDLSAGSVSGNVTAKNVKVHGLDLSSVSGDVIVADATCDRLGVKSVSGNVEYSGGITRAGRYDINVHSGTVRLMLSNPAGFELIANTFSGSIRSDFPLTIGGDAGRRDGRRTGVNNRAIRAAYGDGSASLLIRTFSGDIVITKR